MTWILMIVLSLIFFKVGIWYTLFAITIQGTSYKFLLCPNFFKAPNVKTP
jgi:hypothetical protein